MFKNIMIYTVAGLAGCAELEAALAGQPFAPCSPSQDRAFGWVPPREKCGALVESIAGHWIAKFMIETKSVPGEAIKRRLEERIAHIEANEGRKPGRKECRELRDDIVQELLPMAFAKTTAILVWIDPKADRLVLDCGSQGKADEAITALVKCLPGVQVSALNTQVAPQAAMTQWLAGDNDGWPHHFAPGRFVELHSGDEMRSVVRFDRHHLDDDQMRLHIGQGKLPTKLAMDWDGRMSFVLTESTQLKKVAFLDGVFDMGNLDVDVDQFDQDVAIATGELGALIPDLIYALGGQLEAAPKTTTVTMKGNMPTPPAHDHLSGDPDPLYLQAVDLVMKSGKASISYVQRNLKIGYNRAASLLEDMEKTGLVSPMIADGRRQVIDAAPMFS